MEKKLDPCLLITILKYSDELTSVKCKSDVCVVAAALISSSRESGLIAVLKYSRCRVINPGALSLMT